MLHLAQFVLVIAVIVLTSMSAKAAPSQGKVVGICKSEVTQFFGEGTRAKLRRIRGKKIYMRVSREDLPARNVVCTVSKEGVHLADKSGVPLNNIAKAE